ncbi:MAG: hypothetical protein AAGA56_29635 [Myxococcota bacterium]
MRKVTPLPTATIPVSMGSRLEGTAVALSLAIALAGGCASASSMPNPDDALAAYTAAVKSGDAEALYGMMSEESRKEVSLEELGRVLREQKRELAAHAQALEAPERSVRARAEIRYPDGESATLSFDDGMFRVSSAEGLPATPRSAKDALAQFRRAMARRSYSAVLRLLSPETRAMVEDDLRSLVEGLEDPDALDVEEKGDEARVIVPGGHVVELRRVDGVWHVEDFR